MPRVSLNRPDLKLDPDDPPGFRSAMWRFGRSLGAERVGTTLYEIPPGEAVCPYHYENAETVRVLMSGETLWPAATTYPDSNKIGIWTRRGEGGRQDRLGTELDYYDGEVGSE